MVKREKSNYMIQSVTHALDVMEELAKAAVEIGVTELSKRLKLHKNNVFRLLATLELRGYAEQNPQTEDYRLGVKALQLGQSYLAQSQLVARALPILKTLAEATGETVSLAVLQNGQVQFPISIESKRPVKVAPRVGVSLSAKQNGAGRLLTGHLPDAILTEILSTNTAQDAAIKNQLNELRTTGQLVDRAAIEADVVSVCRVVRAAPANMFSGTAGAHADIVGAIEILVPQYRAKIESIQPHLEEAAQQLSASLGSSKPGLISTIEREIIASNEAATNSGATAASGTASALKV